MSMLFSQLLSRTIPVASCSKFCKKCPWSSGKQRSTLSTKPSPSPFRTASHADGAKHCSSPTGLPHSSIAASAVRNEFLVALEVDERGNDRALVRIASPIQPDWLLDLFPSRISVSEEMSWNRKAERVEQVNAIRYEHLVIDESRSAPADPALAAELLAAKAADQLGSFIDMEALEAFLKRIRFARRHGVDLPSESDLIAKALATMAYGLTSFRELQIAARENALLSIIQSELPSGLIDEVAPSAVRLPNGRRARIEYHDDGPPSVASRLQDFFGMTATPTVARGAVPLAVELLAPNHRPVQITVDLASFWKGLYPQLRKELSRRYPKHAWPEDPSSPR